ncbi:MAG: flagellar filament capping protein FliD [Rouxiella aceris]|uniref:flagellar filament capping protein FliD n=1 Tax=Rouxiella aceris TaxID=2703884 RepID=UPI0028504386|nr:flagellar filament capping protein FliD [Rouxiella aceris]MDR3432234.1 flagellar filament capping protein FliD [Rouxiella aceris]
MASVTSLGSGSGLDLEGLVTKLMASESIPLTQLQTKEATYTSQISNVGQFTSLVSSLQTSAEAMQDSSKVGGIKATSSNTSAFSVSATSAASVGTHSVDVLALAHGQQLVSNSGNFVSSTDALASTSDAVADAKITFTFGTIGTDGTLTADSSKTPLTVDVQPDSSGQITLQNVSDAINASGGSMTASLLTDTTGSTRLILTDSTTGANNAFSVSTALTKNDGSTTTTAGFTKLDYQPGATSPAYAVGQAASDAHIKMDGVDVYRGSNTITDLLSNVTLTLTGSTIPSGSTISQSATLQISSDTSGISTLLNTFVTSYNNLQGAISTLAGYNATTKTGGPLQGDSMVLSLQNQLRSMLNNTFGSTGSSISTLTDLGISFQKDGTLALDSTKLSSAVANHLDQVQSFLGSYDKTTNVVTPDSAKTGFSYQLDQLTTNMLSSTGLIQSKINGLNQTVKTIDNQITQEQARLTQVEANYRAQFTALDTSIASMNATSSYLTQQLASIASLTSSSSK